MFTKIIHYIDERHFGDQVIIYTGKNKNEDVYFAIIKDREEVVYFLLDSDLKKMYPINLYNQFIKNNIAFPNMPKHIDIDFDIDLSNLGQSKCSDFLVRLIRSSIHQL